MIQLLFTFCKYGLLCFGGGYMMIPMILADFVGNGKIFSMEEFGNLLSISQVTPGPVGINTATYVGFLNGGFFGAAAATIGLVFPSLFLVSLAVKGINHWKETRVIRGLLYGTRLASVSMILFAVTVFWGMSVFTAQIPWEYLLQFLTFQHPQAVEGFAFSWKGFLICGTSFILILKTKLSTTLLIVCSGIIGALLAFI